MSCWIWSTNEVRFKQSSPIQLVTLSLCPVSFRIIQMWQNPFSEESSQVCVCVFLCGVWVVFVSSSDDRSRLLSSFFSVYLSLYSRRERHAVLTPMFSVSPAARSNSLLRWKSNQIYTLSCSFPSPSRTCCFALQASHTLMTNFHFPLPPQANPTGMSTGGRRNHYWLLWSTGQFSTIWSLRLVRESALS